MLSALRPVLSVVLAAASSVVAATDLSRTPLSTGAQAKPNVIFGMDNSGSMDFEVLLSGTSDGAFWWDRGNAASGWDANGKLLFNTDRKFPYLFPNGCSTSGRRSLCDGSGHYAIAPTLQLAFLRSSAYNPIYYDPLKSYQPWLPATLSGNLTTYGAASPSAASTDPNFSVTLKLNAALFSQSDDYTFRMLPGMVIPSGASYTNANGINWTTATADKPVEPGKEYDVAISYYPATYWVRETCTPNTTSCARAPDNATLKRYEIKSGNTFPSGRSFEAEMQNFANWFTYARKRRLMLASSMGQVLDGLTGMRVGVVKFNGMGPVTMYDTDDLDAKKNGRVVAGTFYGTDSNGGTPTRETLLYIGNQVRTNKSVIQASCQRNAAVIVTDGFANASTVTVPTYDASVYGGQAPYTKTWSSSLADIALSYYTRTARSTDFTAGKVPVAAANDPNPAADRNPNLHMNTYAITLGPVGNVWPKRTDPYRGDAIAWVEPTDNLSPVSIDDLWHATINGRGTMLRATNPSEAAAAVKSQLSNILAASGAQSAVAFSTPSLTAGESTVYAGIYRPVGLGGDVLALPIDAATGAIGAAPIWSADARLQLKAWGDRRIFSFDGSSGSAFTVDAVGARINPGGGYGASDALVDYLRGDRSNEGNGLRSRAALLGGVINAEPVVDRVAGLVYGSTNEGMVHAFESATGDERWAYVPGFTHAGISAQSQPNWTFQTLLDATPTLAVAGTQRLLVGGAGSAGPGYYALDVTATGNVPEADLARKVLWEFPNAGSSDALRAKVGASVGRPVVVRSAKWGWVALLTSGYNSTGDGKGRLFVLDALTGVVKSEIATTAGSTGSGDAGLAQVSAWLEPDGSARYVYGGDLLGNLWRFDVDGESVLKIASLTTSTGTALPVTATPELGLQSGRRMVFVGTGRLLGSSDLGDTGVNSLFAIWDRGDTIDNLRTKLAGRSVGVTNGVSDASGAAVNWTTQRGWYVDLPAGEKANTDPTLAFGILSWTTNHPSSQACEASSTLYAATAATGLKLPASSFTGSPFYGVVLSPTLASRAAFARLSTGVLADITQQSDASTTVHTLNVGSGVTPRKNVWREIRR